MREPSRLRHLFVVLAWALPVLIFISVGWTYLTPSAWHVGEAQAWVGYWLKVFFNIVIGLGLSRVLEATWKDKQARWREYERSAQR